MMWLEEAEMLKCLLLHEFTSYGIFPSGEAMTYWLEDKE